MSPRRPEPHRLDRFLDELLSTPLDVAPPPDLLPSVLAAVREERLAAERAARRLPVRFERALVGSGALGLAALVGLVGLAGSSGAAWVGRLAVEWARGFTLVGAAAADLARWDWALRLLATLGRASGTVVGSSAGPLLAFSLAALALGAVVGFALLRGRALRPGGLGHAHVLA